MTFLFIILLNTFIANPSISEVRKLYAVASTDETSFNKLKNLLEKETKRTAILDGYYGSTLMIEANYLVNPFSKLSAFNNGKTILEKAIKTDPNNVELRYLRFTIQSEAPSILNYNANLKEDKKIMLEKYKSLTDITLKKNISSYLLNSKDLTSTEKKIINE